MDTICVTSPIPDGLVPGTTSLSLMIGRIVRLIRVQSEFSLNGITGWTFKLYLWPYSALPYRSS